MLVKREIEATRALEILLCSAGFFGAKMINAHGSAHNFSIFCHSDSFGDAFLHKFVG